MMLNLIKAELKYSKFGFIHKYWVFLGYLIYACIGEFNPLNIFCFVMLLIYLFCAYLNDLKESHFQAVILLALSLKQTSMIRIILILIGFKTIYFLGAPAHILSDFHTCGFRGSIGEPFMLGAVALLAGFTYLFVSDMFLIFKTRLRYKQFIFLVSLFIGILVILIASFIENIYMTSDNSGIISIIWLCLGSAALAFISYRTFYNKESHIRVYI